MQQDRFILQQDARASSRIARFGERGTQLDGIVVAQDEVGAQRRSERLQEFLNGFE